MSDTDKADRVHILQVRPDDKLELITLPTWCEKTIDLDDVTELRFKTGTRKRTFLFVKAPVRLVVEVFCNRQEQHGDYSIKNVYASKITGYCHIYGPVTVVCTCDEKIINMQLFVKLCRENGRAMYEYSNEEKKFVDFYGDMLHRLVLGTEKHEALHGPYCAVCDYNHPAADSGSAAADSGSAAADSGSAAAGADIRRSERSRKKKIIFDPSVVKTEEP
jgi:hypothetical protein